MREIDLGVKKHYLGIHMSNKHYVNAETLTAGWIISSGTNSQQAVVSNLFQS
jgi:hypothetical protein